jgi:hypothetical protein
MSDYPTRRKMIYYEMKVVLALTEHDWGYSWNAPCAPNLIFTFLLLLDRYFCCEALSEPNYLKVKLYKSFWAGQQKSINRITKMGYLCLKENLSFRRKSRSFLVFIIICFVCVSKLLFFRFMCMFCRSLFVLLYVFFWPLWIVRFAEIFIFRVVDNHC